MQFFGRGGTFCVFRNGSLVTVCADSSCNVLVLSATWWTRPWTCCFTSTMWKCSTVSEVAYRPLAERRQNVWTRKSQNPTRPDLTTATLHLDSFSTTREGGNFKSTSECRNPLDRRLITRKLYKILETQRIWDLDYNVAWLSHMAFFQDDHGTARDSLCSKSAMTPNYLGAGFSVITGSKWIEPWHICGTEQMLGSSVLRTRYLVWNHSPSPRCVENIWERNESRHLSTIKANYYRLFNSRNYASPWIQEVNARRAQLPRSFTRPRPPISRLLYVACDVTAATPSYSNSALTIYFPLWGKCATQRTSYRLWLPWKLCRPPSYSFVSQVCNKTVSSKHAIRSKVNSSTNIQQQSRLTN